MEVLIRNITFTLCRADSTQQEIIKPIIGGDDLVQWATEQWADVNECGCIATYEGKQIAIAGNIQN